MRIELAQLCAYKYCALSRVTFSSVWDVLQWTCLRFQPSDFQFSRSWWTPWRWCDGFHLLEVGYTFIQWLPQVLGERLKKISSMEMTSTPPGPGGPAEEGTSMEMTFTPPGPGGLAKECFHYEDDVHAPGPGESTEDDLHYGDNVHAPGPGDLVKKISTMEMMITPPRPRGRETSTRYSMSTRRHPRVPTLH